MQLSDSRRPHCFWDRVLGEAVMESPRNLLWLALLPAADVVAGPAILGFVLLTDDPFVHIFTEPPPPSNPEL